MPFAVADRGDSGDSLLFSLCSLCLCGECLSLSQTENQMLELIILTGLQGSGKTTWYRENLAATHVHVSKDLMLNARNRETRQQQQIDEALGAGRSVVVDNTNPSRESRAPLIAIGHRRGARVIAVYFEV